jgi:hypothetical protein
MREAFHVVNYLACWHHDLRIISSEAGLGSLMRGVAWPARLDLLH